MKNGSLSSSSDFEKNRLRWSLVCPQEAERLKERKSSDISFFYSANGELNMRKPSFAYHSLENPSQEAHSWFSQLPLKPIQVLYVYGVGLGYYYEAASSWLKENSQRSLVFFEDDLDVIDRFFETEKAKPLLFDRQVTLFYTGNKEEGYAELDTFLALYSLCPHYFSSLLAYEKELPIKYAEIKAKIHFFANKNRSQTVEYGNNGRVFLGNFFRNMLQLPNSYLGDGLFHQFADRPAIICGAGPSLEKNIDLLGSLKDRAVIISGGTGLNALQTHGIEPHLAVGIDPHPEQFSRLVMLNSFETPFFYRNRVNADAFRIMHGPKLYITGSGGYVISGWFEKQLGIEGELIDEGFNVLNFSLSIAYAMQCNPIICIGIDLSYSKGQSYMPGIISHPIHDRKSVFRTKNYQEDLLIKKDLHGQQVYTLWKWISEALWYSKFAFNHEDFLLVNATEGGIGFPKVLHMTLAEAAEAFLLKEYDMEAIVHGEIQNHPLPEQVTPERIKQLLMELAVELEKCGKICQELCLLFEEALQTQKKANFEELEEQLSRNPAYIHLLKVFNEAFLRAFGYELQRLLLDEGIMPPKEILMRKMQLGLLRYLSLEKTAMLNAADIREEVDRFQISPRQKEYPPFFLKLEETLIESRAERTFYADGQIKTEQSYREKRLHGPSSFFSPKGQLLSYTWFNNGLREGKKTTFYANGSLHSIQEYKEGLKHGQQEYFYPLGNSKSKLTYLDGVLHGEVLLYYPNGNLARSLYYDKGKRSGKEYVYNENGHLMIEVAYFQDKPVGIARQWHTNGVLAKEVLFDEKAEECTVKEWNQLGELLEAAKVESFDYFVQVASQTAKLTESLGEVFRHFNKLTPDIMGSTATSSVYKDLEALKREVEHLHSLSNELSIQSNFNKDNEAIWKSAESQRDLEKRLETLNTEMGKKLTEIQKGMSAIIKSKQEKKL